MSRFYECKDKNHNPVDIFPKKIHNWPLCSMNYSLSLGTKGNVNQGSSKRPFHYPLGMPIIRKIIKKKMFSTKPSKSTTVLKNMF